MSIAEFEEQALKYVWRGLVIAGLLTVLGGGFGQKSRTASSSATPAILVGSR